MKDVGKELLGAADRQFVGQGEVLRLFGIDIVACDQLPSADNAGGVTVYRAFMFIKEESVGLAIARNLLIEIERDSKARAFVITGSHRIGAEVVVPNSVVKIYTA